MDCKIFLDLFLLALKLCQDKPVASQERHKASLHARRSEVVRGQVFSPVELSSERNSHFSRQFGVRKIVIVKCGPCKPRSPMISKQLTWRDNSGV